MLIVMGLVFAQDLPQMGLVPDEGAASRDTTSALGYRRGFRSEASCR
jgi:hypothetical protein